MLICITCFLKKKKNQYGAFRLHLDAQNKHNIYIFLNFHSKQKIFSIVMGLRFYKI